MNLKRERAFKILKITLVSLLVISLITGIVLVTKIGGEKPIGTMTAETLDNAPKLIYPDKSVTTFKQNFDTYLRKAIGVPKGATTNFRLITDSFLAIFQSAQISSDKLDKFSDYLLKKAREKEDGKSDLAMIFEMMFSEVQKKDEDGNLVFDEDGKPVMETIFDPEGNMYKFFEVELYRDIINEIMQETNITLHEIGKLGYYSVLYFSTENVKTQFEKLGEKSFSTLFVDVLFSLQLTKNFLDEGGRLTDARMIAELLYQTGSDLEKIIDTLGIDTLVDILVPKDPFNIFSDENIEELEKNFEEMENKPSEEDLIQMVDDIKELKKIINSSRDSVKFVLYLTKNILLEVKNLSFENFAKFSDKYEINRDKYEKIAYGMFANQIQRGLEATKKESSFDTNEKIVENLASILTINKSFRNGLPTEEDKQAYLLDVSEKLDDLLKDIEQMAKVSKDIDTLEAFNNMPPNDRLELDKIMEKYRDYDFSYLEGTTDFVGILFVNVVLEVYVNSYILLMSSVDFSIM